MTMPVAAELRPTANPNVFVDLSVLDQVPPGQPGATAPMLKPPPRPPTLRQAAPKPLPPPPKPQFAPIHSATQSPEPSKPGSAPADKPSQAATAAPDPTKASPPPPPPPQSEAQPKAPAASAPAVAASIAFPAGAATLPDDAQAELDRIAARLVKDDHLHAELLGYAANDGDASQARRLSLSRALAVRSYLVGRGAPAMRIELRPLGSRNAGATPERVDIVLAER